MQEKERWYENLDWHAVFMFAGVFLLFGFMFILMAYPEVISSLPIINSIIEANERRIDMLTYFNSIAIYSTDCDELKQVQLDLLSYGVDTDSWFPGYSDKTMKLAQERYEILC